MTSKIVLIEWEDSFSMDAWQTRVCAVANSKEPMLCRTAGFMLSESEESIVISHTLNAEDSVCGVMTIPKRCIVKIRKLK